MKFYKFYLDSVEVDPPRDWSELSLSFTESKIIKGLVFQQSVPVEFVGSAYTTILTAFESAICNEIAVLIQMRDGNDYVDIFNGSIYLNDVTFDMIKCSAQAEMKDNSFLGKIENNKDIKFQISANRTKNDVLVSAINQRQIDFFTPSTGVYDQLDVECYDCGEVLRYLITLMTDNTVQSETTWLDASGLVFTSGSAINSPASTPGLYISFKEAFEELDKKLNLSLIINNPLSSTPTIKIEPLGDIFVSEANETLTSVGNLSMRADKELYYEKVEVGSDIEDDPSSFTFPQPQFVGFNREEYHLLGVCNSSEALDLVSRFRIDSNIIEDIIINSPTTYDNDIFIVQTDRPSAAQATRYDEIVSYYYNGSLTNESAVENHFGSIPNSIALYLGNGDDGFIAIKTITTDIQSLNVNQGGATASLVPVTYTDEESDPNNNYTAASSYFTVPLAGTYSFFANLEVSVLGMTGGEATFIALEIVRYSDNTFVTEIEYVDFEIRSPFGAQKTAVQVSASIYLALNNTVRVRLKGRKDSTVTDVNNVEIQISDGAGAATGSEPTFRCVATANGGGIYETFNETDVRRILYTVEGHPMNYTTFSNIVNDIGKLVSISNINKSGWINSLEWNPYRGIANIILRGNL